MVSTPGCLCPTCFTYYGKPHMLGAITRVCDNCHNPQHIVTESRELKNRRRNVKSGEAYGADAELQIMRRRAREEIRA